MHGYLGTLAHNYPQPVDQKASGNPVETVQNWVQNGTKVVEKCAVLLLLRVV
jgi:hypothetical protein